MVTSGSTRRRSITNGGSPHDTIHSVNDQYEHDDALDQSVDNASTTIIVGDNLNTSGINNPTNIGKNDSNNPTGGMSSAELAAIAKLKQIRASILKRSRVNKEPCVVPNKLLARINVSIYYYIIKIIYYILYYTLMITRIINCPKTLCLII